MGLHYNVADGKEGGVTTGVLLCLPRLEPIGLWQYRFRNWFVRASGFAAGPCDYGPVNFWVLPGGRITTTHPPC